MLGELGVGRPRLGVVTTLGVARAFGEGAFGDGPAEGGCAEGDCAGRAGSGARSGASTADRAAERERTYQVTAPTSSASRNQRRRRRGGLSFAMTRG